jgi:hypothetical protein
MCRSPHERSNGMRRESFNYLRTMRQIKTSLDLAREPKRIPTTGARFRASFEKELEPQVSEKAIAVELEEERRKFIRQNQALARARQRVRGTRVALKAKNERLMVLRHALQKQRWLEAGDISISPAPKPRSSDESRDRRARRYRAVRVRRA